MILCSRNSAAEAVQQESYLWMKYFHWVWSEHQLGFICLYILSMSHDYVLLFVIFVCVHVYVAHVCAYVLHVCACACACFCCMHVRVCACRHAFLLQSHPSPVFFLFSFQFILLFSFSLSFFPENTLAGKAINFVKFFHCHVMVMSYTGRRIKFIDKRHTPYIGSIF